MKYATVTLDKQRVKNDTILLAIFPTGKHLNLYVGNNLLKTALDIEHLDTDLEILLPLNNING